TDEEARLDEAFTGRNWCSREEIAPEAMASALSHADLVLNCSRVEGFSNAIAEALSVGAAVLASDVPGNREAVRESGVLFSTEEDFLEKARSLLGSPERRRELGVRARADALVRFSPEREIDALLAAYERALEKR